MVKGTVANSGTGATGHASQTTFVVSANTRLDASDVPHKCFGFNTGVPSPAGAGIVLTPLMLWLWLGPNDPSLTPPLPMVLFTLLWTLGSALLMVAPLATYSWKSIRLRRRYRLPALLGVGLYAGLLLSEPMGTLCGTTLAYLTAIIFSQRRFNKLWQMETRARDTGSAPVSREDGRSGSQPGATEQDHRKDIETHHRSPE